MSSRDVVARDRALGAVLSRWRRDSTRVSLRTRWPGATKFVSSAGPVVPTTVIPLGVPSWETLLSLSLDPGSWVVVGGARILPTGVNGVVRACGIRVAEETTTRESNVVNDFFSLDFDLVTHSVVTYPSSGGTALLEVFDQADSDPFPPIPPVSQIDGHFLLAYPL
jgi:hypothetical protein